jgi:hypothetical protein
MMKIAGSGSTPKCHGSATLLLSYLADMLQVNAPDAAPPEPLPLLGFVKLALEDGEQAGDSIV